ncbi:hypothetical protein MKX03_013146 [Papaver bracteatum]|nr:hypothetical protein MKX03_013146 [Papaver bracteatum]
MKLTPLYYLFTFLMSAHIVFSQRTLIKPVEPLSSFCFGEQNYSSSYGTNLQALLTSFLVSIDPLTGFELGSRGQAEDRVNRIGLCRGDMNDYDFFICLVSARSKIRTHFPYSKGAVIWHDNCTVKYSNEKFFVYLNNVNNVNDPHVFNKKTRELITSLSEKAVVAGMKLFATGEMALGGYSDEKLYGLVQCSRDLSFSNCKKCLPSCCESCKRGGRILGGSCNIRYEFLQGLKHNIQIVIP